MKFCPNCGSVRDGKDKCNCGYNYITEEVEEPNEKDIIVPPNGIGQMNQFVNIEMFQGGVPLEELKRRRLDTGDLLSVSYTTSGGMMGSYHNLECSFEKKQLETINQEWHHGSRIKKVYKVDKKELEEIKKLLIENNFCAWSEIPVNRNLIAYDAPTSSMSLRFSELSTSISTNIYMTQEESDLFIEVKNKIYSLATEENKIEEEVLQEGENLFFNAAPPKKTGSKKSNTSTKFCKECGSKLEDGITQCKECGSIIQE